MPLPDNLRSQHGGPIAARVAAESAAEIVAATRTWLEKAVIGLDLCPFAHAVHVKNQIRYAVSAAETPQTLLADLVDELQLLASADRGEVETTLLIHPWVLADFLHYNDFLAVADAAVANLRLAAVIQVASFHPQYQFDAAGPDDIDNYTNRSPYPTLHLLRQESVDRALAAFPDPARIFEKNIATLRVLGHEGWNRLGLAAPSTPALPGRPAAGPEGTSS
jgi:hypothetical protein